jgi:hypothetical protein
VLYSERVGLPVNTPAWFTLNFLSRILVVFGLFIYDARGSNLWVTGLGVDDREWFPAKRRAAHAKIPSGLCAAEDCSARYGCGACGPLLLLGKQIVIVY